MTLAWNPSTNSDVVGYNIYWGVASDIYTNKIFVGNVTSATVSGLTEGTVYYFAATALNSMGLESPFSNEAVYTVPSPVLLSIQTSQSNGLTGTLTVRATGTLPGKWALQSSPDLRTWTMIAQGTNAMANVPVSVPGIPMEFFRLVGQ
ncbi:MAG: fibronectin type III domain-containing protein [Verrucomicrobiota bacterium]|nr:fibronectin type III domain-containing protein [Verrucomicrobiota bacterium]